MCSNKNGFIGIRFFFWCAMWFLDFHSSAELLKSTFFVSTLSHGTPMFGACLYLCNTQALTRDHNKNVGLIAFTGLNFDIVNYLSTTDDSVHISWPFFQASNGINRNQFVCSFCLCLTWKRPSVWMKHTHTPLIVNCHDDTIITL